MKILTADLRAYNRKWRALNREKCRGYEKSWVKRHPDKAAQREREKYYAKQRRIHGHAWMPFAKRLNLTPEEKRRRRNAQYYASQKRRAKRDPVYAKARNAARHATQRSKAVAGRFSRRDVLKMLDEQKGLCRICDKDIRKSYHVDHIKPLSKDGSNMVSNIQLLCPACNLRKGDR